MASASGYWLEDLPTSSVSVVIPTRERSETGGICFVLEGKILKRGELPQRSQSKGSYYVGEGKATS